MSVRHLSAAILLLSLCSSRCIGQNEPRITLKGTIVTPSQVLTDGAISILGTQIEDVRATVAGVQGNIVETDSFIFPGLIDLHDHITWNVLPRWRPNQLFMNRYEWQKTAAYSIALDQPHYCDLCGS